MVNTDIRHARMKNERRMGVRVLKVTASMMKPLSSAHGIHSVRNVLYSKWRRMEMRHPRRQRKLPTAPATMARNNISTRR